MSDADETRDAREWGYLSRPVMHPVAHPPDVTNRFRDAGAPQAAASVMGALKVALAAGIRRPVRPAFARTLLQMLLIRASARRLDQFSSVEKWSQAPSGEVNLRK